MTEETGEWLECVVDKDYEIWSDYPYPIKRKGNDKVIKEKANNEGYICCSLNHKTYKKHRIIGFQFIDNDDPEHKTQVDHINHNRADDRVENLRWITHLDNQKNKTRWGNNKYTYVDELSNGVKYRELIGNRNQGNIYYDVFDIDNRKARLAHKQLFP